MAHDRIDEKELEGTIDHGYDLIYHDIKEAMLAEQQHHGRDLHSFDTQHHGLEYPYHYGQHGFQG